MAIEPPEFVMTNIRTYLAIAKDAFARSERLMASHRRPKPGGGWVIRHDPNQTSFKHSLVAIVFAAVYLEALLYLQGCRILGIAAYEKIDGKTYPVKLHKLGVRDQSLLDAAEDFRQARNELVHEKAHEQTSYRTAQEEAKKAIELIERVAVVLRGLGKR
jgi:hypothetical protein